MGAWGAGIYDNDDAADWVYDLQSSGASAIASVLMSALGDDEPLEADLGAQVLAAADVLGRLRVGDAAGPGPDGVVAWVAANPADPSASLLGLAERAVDRVLGADSELCALWAEADEYAAWRSGVQTVVGRLL